MTTSRDDHLVERGQELAAGDEDLQHMLAGDWMRYRTSPALQTLTREAHSVCAEINRIYYDSPDTAQRLFRELVPGAGEGIDFRPPISIDYGMRLSIGDRTFINADFLIIGGGLVTIGPDAASTLPTTHKTSPAGSRDGSGQSPSRSARTCGSADRSRSLPA